MSNEPNERDADLRAPQAPDTRTTSYFEKLIKYIYLYKEHVLLIMLMSTCFGCVMTQASEPLDMLVFGLLDLQN